MKRFLLLAVISLIISGISGQNVYKIREVVVQGESETNAFRLMKESGPSSMVISSKELSNLGHNTAGEVLKRLPRIVIQGPPSFYRNIMMAGLDKEFQCVLINGNRPGGGEDSRDFKLDRLPVSMIEKIEVINNPPVSMGADASIGAVNISLKETPDKKIFGGDLSLDKSSTYGRMNPEVSLYYGNKWNKWSLFANGSMNNFKRINIASLSDSNIAGTETETLDVMIGGFTAAVAFEPDSINRWTFQSTYTRYKENLIFLADINRQSSGGLSERADSADDNKLRILHSHTLGYSWEKNNDRWLTDLTFAQNIDIKDKQRIREKTSGNEISLEDEDQTNSEIILKSDYGHSSSFREVKNLFKAGIRGSVLLRDFDRLVYTKMADHMFWDNIEDGSYTLNEYRASTYLADEVSLGKIWLSPAVRFDLDRADYSTAQNVNGKSEYYSINPSLHTRYSINSDYFLKADVARQIARPPFNLMVPVEKVKSKKKIIEKGNPDLVPSKAWNTGFGVERYFNDRGFASLRGFYSVLRDVVETRDIGIDDVYGYRIMQSVNVDSGKIWGVDLSSRVRIMDLGGQHLTMAGNVSWLGSEVLDPETLSLRRLSEQPEWIMNGSLEYLNTGIGIQAFIGINYISERVTPSSSYELTVPNNLVQAAFTQWDFSIKYFFSSWGGIYLNCINLFNETIEYTQGSLNESHVIGRNYVIGISLNL